jgi:uncharacterized protein (DUF58 family)
MKVWYVINYLLSKSKKLEIARWIKQQYLVTKLLRRAALERNSSRAGVIKYTVFAEETTIDLVES